MIRKLSIGLGVLGVLVLAIGMGGYLWIRSAMREAHEHSKANEYVTIDKGLTPPAVVGKLVSEGIIRSGTPVLLYLRFTGGGEHFRAGDYRFRSPISPMEVIEKLEKGESRADRITIPEGFTRFDIAKRIAATVAERGPIAPLDDRTEAPTPKTEDVEAVLALMNDTSAIRDISPEATSLEGYMYPDTYDLDPRSTPATIINAMVEQFRRQWKPEWTDRAKALGLTPHQIVTIASMIETETGVDSERPIVASVIYNRLAKRIPLGIDQTVVYVAKMEGRWDGTINRSDLDVDSPYNTRKFAGLPPGPISSVSASALEAALNPAQTNYIYYVRNVQANDGSHWFYASAADFERGKAEYQKWLKQERSETPNE